MPFFKKNADAPLLLAARHYDPITSRLNLFVTKRRILSVLKSMNGTQPRTLFVEIFPSTIQELMSGKKFPKEARFDPFCAAVLAAKKRGWNVVALDSERYRRLTKSAHFVLALHNWEFHPERVTAHHKSRYLITNFRERAWAKKLKTQPPQPGDIILMHPNHAEPFLEESGLKANIKWINRPAENTVERLNPSELETLRKARSKDRTNYRWNQKAIKDYQRIIKGLRNVHKP